MGILNWILGHRQAAGDGSSPDTAIGVGSVGEEYAWVGRHCPGFALEMQALLFDGGKPFDVLSLRHADGRERKVYFDISRFYGR